MRERILEIRNCTLSYPKPPKRALLNMVNFEMLKGEIVCLLGPNGSGKSTFLKTILGHFDYSGEIILNGVNAKSLSVRDRAKICSYVPQNCHISFPYSVLEVALMGRFVHHRFFYSKSDRDRAMQILATLGIEDLCSREYGTLSGGQKQLVLIARSLLQDSEIILLDEMTSALDMSHSFSLLNRIKSLKKSIILSSHHPEQCFIADKIAMIKDTYLLRCDIPKEALCEEYVSQLYEVSVEKIDLPNGGAFFCPRM